jgi:intracellular multiplication protein IcmO
MSIPSHHAIDPAKLTRDTRSVEQRFWAALFRPANFRLFLVAFIALQLYLPALWPVWILGVWVLTLLFEDQRFSMPLRSPKDLGGLDQTELSEELKEDSLLWGWIKRSRRVRKLALAGGILYLGYLRSPLAHEHGRELWVNDSDARTHLFLAGTTGSGKTKALCGLAFNALCWGSGVAFGDGKASVALPYAMWSMCRRFGREDDFLVCNYLTGGIDPFQRMVAQETSLATQGTQGTPPLAQSNSANAFSEGGADFLLQLMASLLSRASGDGAQWQQKALNMMDAVLRTLCYKRARGELELSIGVIRHYLALHNLVQLYIEGREGKLPEAAFLPLKAYFETGLPGFNPDLAHKPSKWDAEVFNQHGYLTGQFARTLSMMMDTYGHIFSDKYPEIDPQDVLLNNRVLVVLIPSLEKSAAEAAALGKLYTSTQRLMMAQTLGYQLEGSKTDILDARPSNRPNPYLIINDELAYWFAEGLAVMFAQARELGFMMVASVQDVQGLKRGDAGDEAASVIANTKIKWTLALEDPEDTFDLIRKSGGEGYYSMLSGHDAVNGTFTSGHSAQTTLSIERRDRVSLAELKDLNPGEGVVMFKKSVLPSAAFYLPDEQLFTSHLQARINRFVQIEKPSIQRLPRSARSLPSSGHAADAIVARVRRAEAPYFPELDDPILDAVRAAATYMNGIERFEVGPVERGIVLFEAARQALRQAQATGRTGHLHEAHHVNPPQIQPVPHDEEMPEYAFLD